MDAAPAPAVRALGAGALALTGLVGAALLGAVFAGDGSGADGVLPVGGGALLVLLGALVTVAAGALATPRLGRSGGTLVLSLLALVAWTGATVAWSIVADRSWDAFNKCVVFAVFLGLGIVLAAAAGRVAARVGAWLLVVVTGAALAWALLGKAIPSLDPDGDRIGRLREPVGYWNALALLADIAIVLGLWAGTERAHRLGLRVAGGLLVYVATLSLMLTLSRAGAVAGVAVVALWLLLSSERLASGLLLVGAAGPALLVGAWAFTRPALVEAGAARPDREADGVVFGVFALAGAALVAVLVVLASRRALAPERRRTIGRGLAAAGAIVAVALAALLVVGSVAAVSQGRDCAEVENDPGRFGTLESARLCWWGEAWDVFAGHRPEGAGAGTFEVARKRYRVDARSVSQPHSVPLQQLADGGVAALAFFVLLLATGAATCVCALRRLEGPERAAAAALVAAPAAYALHALVDFSWDFLAVTAPTTAALGLLAVAGRPTGPKRRHPVVGLGVILVALAVLVSFAAPRQAERDVRASTRELSAGELAEARDLADRARRLNPLSVAPILAQARIYEVMELRSSAERKYIEAVELQPENPETWYALGLYEFQVLERMCAAYRFLNNAWTLDPAGSQWVPGGELDIARDAVNAGACEPR
jgi:hypothetical protein